MDENTDVLVITAVETERDAVRDGLKLGPAIPDTELPRSYYQRELTTVSKSKCVVTLILLHDAGNPSSASATAQVLTRIKPRKVIVVGIAGAIDQGLSVGDVIVGTNIWYYERDKVEGKKRLPEPREIPADSDLLDRVQNPTFTWPPDELNGAADEQVKPVRLQPSEGFLGSGSFGSCPVVR